MSKVLVIGACGQLGSELTLALIAHHGIGNVIASDISTPISLLKDVPFEQLDVLDREKLKQLVADHQITAIYHLAAVLSAKGEEDPRWAWQLNMDGLLNVLETANEQSLAKVFWPSSIAAFGQHTPKQDTPQNTVMDPATVYGISKLSGELWCQYYCEKYQLDVRSLRYPGLISYQAPPGGGTTDYAIDIFHKAVRGLTFECFLSPDTRLPMMYMPDAVKATLQLMQAPAQEIHTRTSYNLSAINFTPKELAAAIADKIPDFSITYKPDYRQKIAETWPESINDQAARDDWGWKPDYDLTAMTTDMLLNLAQTENQIK